MFTEESEWPPSPFTIRVFSSRKWRWEERSLVRRGDAAGTVADMRSDRQQEHPYDVYWQGALYVQCQNGSVMRIILSDGEYEVIKPLTCSHFYLGKSKGLAASSQPHSHSLAHTHTHTPPAVSTRRRAEHTTVVFLQVPSHTRASAPPDGGDIGLAVGGAAAAFRGGGGVRGAGAGAGHDDLRGLGGGRRQQQPAGHAGARRLPALRPRLPRHPRAHRPLLQRQARHRLHRREPGADLVPAGVPGRGGADQQQEPPPRRQLRLRRRRVPRRHRRALRRDLAGAAAGLLQGVPVQGGRGGRQLPRGGADVGVHLRGERRHQRLRAELLRQRHARRRIHARPVRRRAHDAIHRIRREPVRAGCAADRRDVAAAHGVPAGVRDPLRRWRRHRQWRVRGAAEQRLAELQHEAAGGVGVREEAAPGPEARRLRHLQPAAQPRHRPQQRRVLRGPEGVLRDGDDRDVGAVQPGGAGDVRQRHGLRLLGRVPPHRRRQQGARRRAAPPGTPAHLLILPRSRPMPPIEIVVQ